MLNENVEKLKKEKILSNAQIERLIVSSMRIGSILKVVELKLVKKTKLKSLNF